MEKEKVLKALEKLQKSFGNYELDCYREIGFVQKHKFEMEEMAIRYKIEAYNRCKRDVFLLIDELGKEDK